MKRAIGLTFLVIVCILGFLTVKGSLPFMPVSGRSMEPTLHSGSLLVIKPVNPADVKVGDIIAFNVPSAVRDYYNYPPVVSRRVIEVMTVPSLGFHTKGDNTGEDPFTTRPVDVRGTVGNQIPYLGLPLLLFQSPQSFILVFIALLLLAVFLYSGEILRKFHFLRRGIFAPYFNEEKNTNLVLTRKIDATEKKVDTTEQALEKFSAAISDYAQHLASHTSAVQSLAEASHELKKGAAEQNRVLMALAQNIGKIPVAPEAPAPAVKPPATEKPRSLPPEAAKTTKPPPAIQKTAGEKAKPVRKAMGKPVPPGCARNREDLPEQAIAAENEIFSALERLHKKLEKPKD
jgi:signal peptidase